jgi:hypothetical protein
MCSWLERAIGVSKYLQRDMVRRVLVGAMAIDDGSL